MELEITVTPRETLVWAAKAPTAQELRRKLEESGHLVRDADPFELTSAGLIPEGEHLEFDPTPTGATRTDIVDKNGKVTLCYAGHIRHLGIGRPYSGTPVLPLIHNRDVSVSNTNTGQIIAEFTIDPSRDYQAKNP